MEEVEKIINLSKGKMKEMLKSVLDFNSQFLKTNEDIKRLERILYAITLIDRKYFAKENSYEDSALEIGEGQTISQPSTVARMLMLAEISEDEDILEVGSGSGWNAALLAYLVYPGNVASVDRFETLIKKAESNINSLRGYLKQKKPEVAKRLEKMNFIADNIFHKNNHWNKKYDKIIFTAGVKNGDEHKIEKIAKDLLKQNGILICPHENGPLLILKKEGKITRTETKENYVFVPLVE